MITQWAKLIKYISNRHFKAVRLSLLSVVITIFPFCNTSNAVKNSNGQHINRSADADSSVASVQDSSKNNVISSIHSYSSFPYDLEKPDKKYTLPEYLKEISGLAYYKDDMILSVQDEKADIYVFDTDNMEIVDKYNFGKKGDYEDIAVIGQTAFVMRSDGHLFEVENFNSERRKVTDHNTLLSAKNNTEGLAYDKSSNSLLIACKGSPSIEKDNPYKGYKAIYQYDLSAMKLHKKPQLIMSKTSYEPSGLSINPVFDEIYLISGTGKVLIIMDRNGKVSDVHHLDSKIFKQPEGICFSPSGDMFISNEGRGGKGNILRFNLRRNE
jgi:uncharacterized protein YjiK